MVEMLLIESVIHLVTFLVVLIPVAIVASIFMKERGEELINSLLWIVVGLLPLAVYHLFEFLHFVGLDLLPQKGTLNFSIVSHSVVAIAFLSVGWFAYLFKKRYVDPVYSKS